MEGDGLQSDISEFVKITSSTRDQAKFFLEASGGDLDNAVMMYMGKLGSAAMMQGGRNALLYCLSASGATLVLNFEGSLVLFGTCCTLS